MNATDDNVGSIFTAGERDLSEYEFTGRQKAWLASPIINGEETAKSVARRFNLSRKLINNLISRSRRGTKLQAYTGRPRSFDEDGIWNLVGFSLENPPPSYEECAAYVSDLYEETHRNEHIADGNGNEHQLDELIRVGHVEVARRSWSRYATLCCTQSVLNMAS